VRAYQVHLRGPQLTLLRAAVPVHIRNRAGNGERNQSDYCERENHYDQCGPFLERVLEAHEGFQSQPLSFQLDAVRAGKILPPEEDICRSRGTFFR
jgi:hypothetical protein